MTVHFCDCCGEKVNNPKKVSIENCILVYCRNSDEEGQIHYQIDSKYAEVDLCDNCFNSTSEIDLFNVVDIMKQKIEIDELKAEIEDLKHPYKTITSVSGYEH